MKLITSGAIVIALLSSSVAMAKPDHGNQSSGHQSSTHQSNWHQSNGNHSNGNQANGRYARNYAKSNNGRHLGWAKDRGNQHRWSRGQRMGYNDWRNAPRVDYRQYRLRQPPRGYEWRQQNNQFILVAAATGLIASIILSSGR